VAAFLGRGELVLEVHSGGARGSSNIRAIVYEQPRRRTTRNPGSFSCKLVQNSGTYLFFAKLKERDLRGDCCFD